MIVQLLTKHHLEFLSLEEEAAEACPSSTLVKMSNCWKSYAVPNIQCIIT